MFHWYVLAVNFLICFWIYVVFSRAFDILHVLFIHNIIWNVIKKGQGWCVIWKGWGWHVSPLWSLRSNWQIYQEISLIYLTFWVISLISLTVGKQALCIPLGCCLVTTCKQSLGQGNIFTSICHTVHRGVLASHHASQVTWQGESASRGSTSMGGLPQIEIKILASDWNKYHHQYLNWWYSMENVNVNIREYGWI